MKKLSYLFITALVIMAISCTKSSTNINKVLGFWSGYNGSSTFSILFKENLTARSYANLSTTTIDTATALTQELTYFLRNDSVFATNGTATFNGKIVGNQILAEISGAGAITVTKQ